MTKNLEIGRNGFLTDEADLRGADLRGDDELNIPMPPLNIKVVCPQCGHAYPPFLNPSVDFSNSDEQAKAKGGNP